MTQYAISWSRQQRCLHRETLAEALETNQAMLRGELPPNDYLMVWVGTEEESGTALASFESFALAYRTLDQARDPR